MALEAISGSAYFDIAKPTQKPDTKINDIKIQEQGLMKTTANETPAISKTAGSQPGSEQGSNLKGNTSEKQIRDVISRANNKMKNHRTRFEFNYHEETKRVSIKVIDKDTEEIIREIPPEETLEMIERMWELAGILVDERR